MTFIKRLARAICRRNNGLSKCCDVDYCCTSGNQCTYWNNIDFSEQQISALPNEFFETIGHRDSFRGWSKLGNSFDVIQTASFHQYYTPPSGACLTNGEDEIKIQINTRTIRFRLGPLNLTTQQRADRFGPTQKPNDVWRKHPIDIMDGSVIPSFSCASLYIDEGIYTGTIGYGSRVFSSYAEVTFTNLNKDELQTLLVAEFGFFLGNHLLPHATGPWVNTPVQTQSGPGQINPVMRTGIAWMPYRTNVFSNTATPLIISRSVYVPSSAFDSQQYIQNYYTALRMGGNVTAQGVVFSTPAIIDHTFDCYYGESSIWKVDRVVTPTVGGCTEITNVDFRNTLVRNPVDDVCNTLHALLDTVPNVCDIDEPTGFKARLCSNSSEYITPANSRPATQSITCLYDNKRYYYTQDVSTDEPVQVVWSEEQCPDFRVGVNCTNPTDTVVFDNNFRPGSTFKTFIFDLKRYFPTDTSSDGPGVSVQWSTDNCLPEGEFAFADICDTRRITANFPARIKYKVNTSVGLGNGRVFIQIATPNPDCPSQFPMIACVIRVYYRPTTEITTGPERLGSVHQSFTGNPCRDRGFFVCGTCDNVDVDPGGPIIRPGSTLNQDNPNDGNLDDDSISPSESIYINKQIVNPFPTDRKPYPIPEDFDIEAEQRRTRNGGCCGEPTR